MKRYCPLPWNRHGQNHAQVHFPPLTAEEAVLTVKLLQRIANSLWRAHGDAMADFLACHDPDDLLPNEDPFHLTPFDPNDFEPDPNDRYPDDFDPDDVF